MNLGLRARLALYGFLVIGLAFIYVPLAVVVVNSFNSSRIFSWPPKDLTLQWWSAAAGNTGLRDALWTSVSVAAVATAIATVLGGLLALGLSRYEFFGRRSLHLLAILPIALPGIVTALALRTGFRTILDVDLSIWTIIIAHATFCVVVMYNNVSARLRRMGDSLEQASMDLGAGPFTTFWKVTLPNMRGAIIGGAVLAFALSFDEIVVTLFTAPAGTTTLPVWIFQNLFRPNQAPIVNVVAAALIVFSIIPVYVSQRFTRDD